MELEEMKNAWLALGDQLDKRNKLSDIIIRDMYQTKVKKSINTLLRSEYLGIIVCLLVLPFIGWLISSHTSLLYRLSLGYWGVFAIASTIWTLKKVILLMKIDETGAIAENMKLINTYTIWVYKEKKCIFFFTFIGIVPIVVIYWLYAKPWHWVFMSSLFVLALLITIWGYKRLYGRNIQVIKQSLNELKDLED